ncbi:PCI-domain-containing protein [Ramicandelaber brevisporus]|nr:PCI-domain-containing protein [Ramicandelaber brevisporus]
MDTNASPELTGEGTAATKLTLAETFAKSQPERAVVLLQEIASSEPTSDEPFDRLIRIKERALLLQADIYVQHQQPEQLAALIRSIRPFLATIPRAKSAKLLRTVLDKFAQLKDTEASLSLQMDLCRESIQWAQDSNMAILRQSLETRMVALYLAERMYTEALELIKTLLFELKKLDDKLLLVEVFMLEARAYFELKNRPKARASQAAARTEANAVYTPGITQAALDIMSGILHAEDNDYKTAYSYFFEAFEGYTRLDDKRAIPALKYMILCKVMLGAPEEVLQIVKSKSAQKFAGRDVDAMVAVSDAYKNRSLGDCETALNKYPVELQGDEIIKSHLVKLYDQLLEQNLLRVIEPYSRVEIAHIASLVRLPVVQVEQKLSQMILDKLLKGIIDQDGGFLMVFDPNADDNLAPLALDTIKQMDSVVSALYEKAAAFA